MALSDDLHKRVMDAVVVGGLSRNAAAKRFGVSIASAIVKVWTQKHPGMNGKLLTEPSGLRN